MKHLIILILFLHFATNKYAGKSVDMGLCAKAIDIGKNNGDFLQLNSESPEMINRNTLDSLIVKHPYYSIYKNLATNRYSLRDSVNVVRYDNIKDFSIHNHDVQIITNENELTFIVIFYDEYRFKDFYFKSIKDEYLLNFSFICGTVPHYLLYMKETESTFDLYSDETYYDHENNEPATKYLSISKTQADDVFFINMLKTMYYSSNDETQYSQTPIIKKNNQYSIGLSNNFYDTIQSTESDFIIKKDNLLSYYNINKTPKYTKLENFIGDYARFELSNGQKGYLKIDGNEIYD